MGVLKKKNCCEKVCFLPEGDCHFEEITWLFAKREDVFPMWWVRGQICLFEEFFFVEETECSSFHELPVIQRWSCYCESW